MNEFSPSPAPSMDNYSHSHSLVPLTCYRDKDSDVCVRIAVLLALIMITAALLIARIIQYHCYRNNNYEQYFVLYTGVLITFILFIHTIYYSPVQLEFTIILLAAVQLLTICLCYLFWAFRLLKHEKLFLYGALPLVLLLGVAFVGVYIWAAVKSADDSEECKKPQWLIFSTSQLIIVQLLLATVIYISCKLNLVRTKRINKWSQKVQLTFIVTVFEIIAVIMFIYDLYLMLVGKNNCQTAVSRNEGVIIFMEILIKFLRMLAPQIAIVIIFAPLKPNRSRDPDDTVENIGQKFYYPRSSNSHATEKDPLLPYPIHHPPLKPSSPEEHFPSLPRSSPYSSTSGYNFYQFKATSTSVN